MSWRHWWVYDPGILLREWDLWPSASMDYPRQLNALTRCLLIIFLILMVLKKYKQAWWLLFIGLIAIIIAGFQLQSRESTSFALQGQRDPIVLDAANRPYNPDRPLVSHLRVEESAKFPILYSEQLRTNAFAVAPRRGE